MPVGLLDLGALAVNASTSVDLRDHQELRVTRKRHSLLLRIPDADDVTITILGFSAGGASYSMTANSFYEGTATSAWTTSGSNVASPTFPDVGDYVLEVTATPNVGTAMLSTVSMKIRKPGK